MSSTQYKTTGNTKIEIQLNLSFREEAINRHKPWDGQDIGVRKIF